MYCCLDLLISSLSKRNIFTKYKFSCITKFPHLPFKISNVLAFRMLQKHIVEWIDNLEIFEDDDFEFHYVPPLSIADLNLLTVFHKLNKPITEQRLIQDDAKSDLLPIKETKHTPGSRGRGKAIQFDENDNFIEREIARNVGVDHREIMRRNIESNIEDIKKEEPNASPAFSELSFASDNSSYITCSDHYV